MQFVLWYLCSGFGDMTGAVVQRQAWIWNPVWVVKSTSLLKYDRCRLESISSNHSLNVGSITASYCYCLISFSDITLIIIIVLSAMGTIPDKLHDSLQVLNPHSDRYAVMQRALVVNTCCVVWKVFGRTMNKKRSVSDRAVCKPAELLSFNR